MTVADFKRLSKDEQRRFAQYQVGLCQRAGIGGGGDAQLGELALVAGSFDTCDRWAAEYKARGGNRCSFDLWGDKCFSWRNGAEAVWDAKWDIVVNSVTLGLYDCAHRTGSYIADSSAPSSDAAWAVGSCAAAGLQLSSLSAAGSSAGIIESTTTRTGKTIEGAIDDIAQTGTRTAATNNPVPGRVARIVEEDVLDRGMTTLGHPSSSDVFVTAADDIAGLNSAQIGERLTLLDGTGAVRKGPFAVIEFDTPGGIASPLNRTNPGFINGGRAAGGAREFVVPNSPLDQLTNLVIRRPG